MKTIKLVVEKKQGSATLSITHTMTEKLFETLPSTTISFIIKLMMHDLESSKKRNYNLTK